MTTAPKKWTWETSVALVLAYTIMGSLVWWGFGWSAMKTFFADTLNSFGFFALVWVATFVLAGTLAVLVALVFRMLTSRRAKRPT